MLEERARGAAVVVPLVVVVLAVGQPVLGLGLAALAAAGAHETFRLLERAGWPSSPWLGVAVAAASTLLLALGASTSWPLGPALTALLLLCLGLGLAAVAAFPRTDPRDGVATWIGTAFGALYLVPLGFAGQLGSLAPSLPADAPLAPLGGERTWVVLLVLTVWAYDTGAYLVGSRFGRRRFLRHLSPSKTEAGLLGGLAAATLVAGLGFVGAGQSVLGAALFGPLVGLAAQAGDLAESMLKRAAGAKDSGSLIPGHGGVLDRVDSFVVAAPVAALLLALLGA
ncbi:MAG TPA: phosphatidate cytidylyltransferase [Candidatus Binatia bacterium]|nr:phosphatidate cytidylyltransferase [Candidatus Binatia bacterium]